MTTPIATPSRWDEKFAAATAPGATAEVLLHNRHLLPKWGCALDIACGLGSGALFLAGHGLATTAWDSSPVALQKLQAFAHQRRLAVTTHLLDLEQPFSTSQAFDVINVNHYLHRPLCPRIIALLKPGGLLFYQTWTQQKSSDEGPASPAFLLARNELLALFAPLAVVAYREEAGCGDLAHGLRNRAWLVAQKP